MEIENICIIMSTYNGEQYVKEQIESILQQKNVNINIVIRDDGSTDSTFNIISDFKNKNSNISIIKGNNILHSRIKMMYGSLKRHIRASTP